MLSATLVNIIIVLAIIPAIVLMVFIYIKDKADKEPIELLFFLLLGGVFACVPAAYWNKASEAWINRIWDIASEYDVRYLPQGKQFLYYLSVNTVGPGIGEELCKFLVLWLITHRNRNFNSLFDGIIYAATLAIGFAVFENLMYGFSFGIHTVLVRMVTAVPGHTFNGILMGLFYTRWHMYYATAEREKTVLSIMKGHPLETGAKTPPVYRRRARLQLIPAMLVPMLEHSIYDFLAVMGYKLLFYLHLGVLYAVCFVIILVVSRRDRMDVSLTGALLTKKYPFFHDKSHMYNKGSL